MRKIKKRNNEIVNFEVSKIEDAIKKAFKSTKELPSTYIENVAQNLAKSVSNEWEANEDLKTVEDIQNLVEIILMKNEFYKTAKAYILYRKDHERDREAFIRLEKKYEEITFGKTSQSDLKRENANIDGNTAMGSMLRFGSEGAKDFYLRKMLNSKHSKAHIEGDIHIHDLDFYSLTTTCCQIDLKKLFKNGFNTGHGYLREPSNINTYAALACIAIQANQNDQHGGQAIPKFDYDMAEGVKKSYVKKIKENICKLFFIKYDNLDPKRVSYVINNCVDKVKYPIFKDDTLYDDIYISNIFNEILDNLVLIDDIFNKTEYVKSYLELKNNFKKIMKITSRDVKRDTQQAMESFIHNLNTMHSRAGSQVPFSSINYGTDTSFEGRLVVKCLLEATIAGLGNGETPIFPIQIFKVKKGVNFEKGDPNYDLFLLACECTAKRMFPNFSFLDSSFNKPYLKENKPETECAYMGCRTRVIGNIHDKDREIVIGRGNLSFTSINLPRLAIKSCIENNVINGNVILKEEREKRKEEIIKTFFKKLNEMLHLTIDQLLERFEVQASKLVKNYPFLMGSQVWIDSENLNSEDEVREILKHGTLSVGFIGLAEVLTALTGSHHGESEESKKLGIEIIKKMREFCDEKSAELNLNITLLATPAEGLSGRFVLVDKKLYGEIEGVTDKEYYTNSFHIPVAFEISAYEKLKIEGEYHKYTNAGHISYIELDGDTSKNPEAIQQIVKAMANFDIGYGAINHPIDRDPICGYTGIIDNNCPKCGRTEDDEIPFERIRRITGYLVGTVDKFNNGKRAEEKDRVKHTVIVNTMEKF